MNELKTLKEFEIQWGVGVEWGDGFGIVRTDELKVEAIKWIKKLKENTWIKENAKFADDETGTNHTIAWIKHFFNITDEELSKEVIL